MQGQPILRSDLQKVSPGHRARIRPCYGSRCVWVGQDSLLTIRQAQDFVDAKSTMKPLLQSSNTCSPEEPFSEQPQSDLGSVKGDQIIQIRIPVVRLILNRMQLSCLKYDQAQSNCHHTSLLPVTGNSLAASPGRCSGIVVGMGPALQGLQPDTGMAGWHCAFAAQGAFSFPWQRSGRLDNVPTYAGSVMPKSVS